MFKKIFNAIIGLFKSNKVKVEPLPKVNQPEPKPAEPVKAPLKNKGTTKNPDFDYLWATCQVDQSRVQEVANICTKILANKDRYIEVQIATGVPWYMVAALHYREASLSFNTVLHNGELLTNVTKYGTRLVPKGRGKGKNWNWQDAAIDALIFDKVHKADLRTIPKCLEKAESYNGLGYRKTGELSPYVWAGTNHHDETGKYVADGKFSSTAQERQLGVAAILRGLGV